MRKIMALGFLLLLIVGILEVQGASIVVNGPFAIYNDGENLICADFVCPKGSVRCDVTKKTQNNNAKLVDITKICYSSSGAIEARKDETIESESPGVYYNVLLSGGAGTAISNVDPVVGERIAEDVNKITHKVQEDVERATDSLNKELKQLEHQLQNVFAGWR